MDDRPHATDNALDQTDQQLLIFTASDEELEKAAGGATWAGTGVTTCAMRRGGSRRTSPSCRIC